MRCFDTLPTNAYLMLESPRSPHTTTSGSHGSMSCSTSASATRPARTSSLHDGMAGLLRASSKTPARSRSKRSAISAHSALKSAPFTSDATESTTCPNTSSALLCAASATARCATSSCVEEPSRAAKIRLYGNAMTHPFLHPRVVRGKPNQPAARKRKSPHAPHSFEHPPL